MIPSDAEIRTRSCAGCLCICFIPTLTTRKLPFNTNVLTEEHWFRVCPETLVGGSCGFPGGLSTFPLDPPLSLSPEGLFSLGEGGKGAALAWVGQAGGYAGVGLCPQH